MSPSRVVMMSGGAGSWAAARRTAERHGRDRLDLLFADTLIEDEDLYRFLLEAVGDVFGIPVPARLLFAASREVPPLGDREARRDHLRRLAEEAGEWCPRFHWIAEGREPHEVFRDRRFLGNSRVDPCSAVLKRELMRRWLERHRSPAETVAVIGYDWSEIHRLERAAAHWEPWAVEAPLVEKPYLDKYDVLGLMAGAGIEPPRLYREGFRHNNCGGFCVKGGQASFALLLRTHPDRYRYHEAREEEFRQAIGRDVAILRDRRGGRSRPLTLRRLRRRLERDPGALAKGEWGACSCLEQPAATGRAGASPRAGRRR